MKVIEVNGLRKYYKTLNRQEGLIGAFKTLFSRDYTIVKAVNDIDFSVHKGEIIGFIGPNGAGKSTTIKMLIGVLKPTGGMVKVNEYIPFKQRTKYLKNIGIVFGQRTQLWWELPVLESFKILKEIYQVHNDDYNKNLALFNDLINIKEFYPQLVRNLSLGQRMICDIAASFLHNPSIIFLDEPTIGLDISIKNKLRNLIKQLNAIKKTTIFITSHDIYDIETLCRRIIIIDKGSVIYDGDIESIKKVHGAFRTLKIKLLNEDDGVEHCLNKEFVKVFGPDNQIRIIVNEKKWVEIIFNQNNIVLPDILNCIMKKYLLRDIAVVDVNLENIIQKVYEGELK